jgi:hypothetical protein
VDLYEGGSASITPYKYISCKIHCVNPVFVAVGLALDMLTAGHDASAGDVGNFTELPCKPKISNQPISTVIDPFLNSYFVGF